MSYEDYTKALREYLEFLERELAMIERQNNCGKEILKVVTTLNSNKEDEAESEDKS